ncbi:MAG: hypothetical protein P4M09_27265 [Devosia sp.]|nr:hypothetical protein [Devosia sp.]
MSLRRLLLTLPVCLGLVACATIPLGSIVPLARIDLMTTDLTKLRAALRLPRPLRPQPGGVAMDVVLKADGVPDQTASLTLTETTDPADLARLPPLGNGQQRTYVYRLAPAEIARFDALRKTLAGYRAAHLSSSLGFGIATREFCTETPLEAGPVPTSSFLLTSETGTFVTLIDGLNLRDDPKLAAAFASLAAC